MGAALLVAATALAGAAGAITFEDGQEAAGIVFRHAGPVPLSQELIEVMGAGACWGDVDGDGYEDLYLVNQPYRNPDLNRAYDPHGKLFLNRGDGTFEDGTAASGTRTDGWTLACLLGDLEGDGDLDLLILGYGIMTLLRNDGQGAFTNATAEAGFDIAGACGAEPCMATSAGLADYDLDGDLDIYVTDYVAWHFGGGPPFPDVYDGQPNRLWRNDGGLRFTDVTEEANAAAEHGVNKGRTFQVVWLDYDRDGWPDISAVDDGTPNHLLRNERDGTFREVSREAGIDNSFGSMGHDVGDEDGDGWPDLYVTNFVGQWNNLYLNNRDGTFRDEGATRGLGGERPYSGWGTGFHDLDNDGDQDLYVVNGVPMFELDTEPNQTALLWRNDGGTYVNMSGAAGPSVPFAASARGSAVADHDLDGDLDVAVANVFNQTARLWVQRDRGGHWLQLELRQPGANPRAIGAEVVVDAPGLPRQWRWVKAGNSFMGNDWATVHVGLGAATEARVEVRWPGGGSDAWTLAADQHVRLHRGSPRVQDDTLAPRTSLRLAGPPGDEGWFRGPVSVALDVEERGVTRRSGVAWSEARAPGGAWAPYEGPLTVAGDGVRVAQGRSADLDGNAEPPRSATVRIDATPPSSAPLAFGSPQGRLGWWRGAVTVGFEAADATSGVRIVEARVDGGRWVPGFVTVEAEGRHVVEHAATDRAGNREAPRAFAFGVDRTPPEAAFAGPRGAAVLLGPAELRIDARDAVSGVAEVRFHLGSEAAPRFVDADGADGWSWPLDPATLPAGVHVVRAVAEDLAGHEAEDRLVVAVPRLPPPLAGGLALLAAAALAGRRDAR